MKQLLSLSKVRADLEERLKSSFQRAKENKKRKEKAAKKKQLDAGDDGEEKKETGVLTAGNSPFHLASSTSRHSSRDPTGPMLSYRYLPLTSIAISSIVPVLSRLAEC